VRGGERLGEPETLDGIRARAASQLASLPDAVARLSESKRYPVGYDEELHARASGGGR